MLKNKIDQVRNLSNYLFLGADIHKNNHTFVALNNLGQRVGQCFTTDSVGDLKELDSWIKELKVRFSCQVILGLEDSSGNGERISKFLVGNNYQVFDINPVLTAQRRKRTIHQDKSDLEDALLIAKTLVNELDSLPRVKVSEQIEIAKNLKGVVADYGSLVKDQTRIKNQLHRLLYQRYGSNYQKKFSDPFSKKALSFWLKETSRQREGPPTSLDPKDNSGLTVAPSQLKDTKKKRIRQKVIQLIFIKEQLKELTKIMEGLFSWLPYQNLITLDGCGLLTTSKIVGEIQDISKFSSSDKLAKYAGLAPQENSSGRTQRHRKSKFGNRQLNKAFYQIALSQIGRSSNTKALNYYRKKTKEGKNKKRALKSLARRNVDIVYAMMRDGSDYDPDYKKKLT